VTWGCNSVVEVRADARCAHLSSGIMKDWFFGVKPRVVGNEIAILGVDYMIRLATRVRLIAPTFASDRPLRPGLEAIGGGAV